MDVNIFLFSVQLDQARDRLTKEAEMREEKILAIKKMIDAEKQVFVAAINQRLDVMIKNIVTIRVKERVKAQVCFCVKTPINLCSCSFKSLQK